jgi:hypothetical protein
LLVVVELVTVLALLVVVELVTVLSIFFIIIVILTYNVSEKVNKLFHLLLKNVHRLIITLLPYFIEMLQYDWL